MADPLEIFKARAEARAYLVGAGQMTLLVATDALQEAAEQQGLIEALGQDVIQAIMADAFRKVPR